MNAKVRTIIPEIVVMNPARDAYSALFVIITFLLSSSVC
jgi:hypothetical protein